MFNVIVKGEEIVHRQLLVICDFYWFSTLRIKINAENTFVDEGSDTVVAVKPTFQNITPSLFAHNYASSVVSATA